MNSNCVIYAPCSPKVLEPRSFSLLPCIPAKPLWVFLTSWTQDSPTPGCLSPSLNILHFIFAMAQIHCILDLKHWGLQGLICVATLAGFRQLTQDWVVGIKSWDFLAPTTLISKSEVIADGASSLIPAKATYSFPFSDCKISHPMRSFLTDNCVWYSAMETCYLLNQRGETLSLWQNLSVLHHNCLFLLTQTLDCISSLKVVCGLHICVPHPDMDPKFSHLLLNYSSPPTSSVQWRWSWLFRRPYVEGLLLSDWWRRPTLRPRTLFLSVTWILSKHFVWAIIIWGFICYNSLAYLKK